MKRMVRIGEGYKKFDSGYEHPYFVWINIEDNNYPIGLEEGSGHSNSGGNFKLSDMLNEIWKEHLVFCSCEKLIQIAMKEKKEKKSLSAKEIYKIWMENK
ncbi:MAG: hypothetical protein GY714_30840 [Desulfobacterales bacterium]|nr:hypothetical protein [Desulfobacterales bacterium]